ncbi:hypothetical protein RhiirA4_482300 [Rhizophagus irregularis]|uniref:Uncharacterized protein n=1 Tax=Rhizophagus irregularis TaxID=588596 RepID=A0A2I1HKV7_9GLOM|nr:hypothetical protein RhiirA4_482300 [Rhizophagus irregularis]
MTYINVEGRKSIQDNKEIGDKRPILESPSPSSRKTWSSDEIRNSPSTRREYRKELEGSRFTFSTPLTDEEEDEDLENTEEQEEEEVTRSEDTKMTSPSLNKEGKKKKKRRKKKKQK